MLEIILPQLSKLRCFNHVETVVPIISGLSSQCYQVHADNNFFFAKQLTTENEAALSVNAAFRNISPKVIYHDKHWLITQFIDGENLSNCSQSIDEKILISIKLMSQCHQLETVATALLPKEVTDELIHKVHFSSSQQAELQQIAHQLTCPLIQTTNLVCCHGDLNFSNILFSLKGDTLLVDYECAYTAPAEYDLAMFIAVNGLPKDKITAIIDQYKLLSGININITLLHHYLLFCYFINSLWYIEMYHKTGLSKFDLLSKQQWKQINLQNKTMF